MQVDCTVAAVVVTYNRKEQLLECVDALLSQTRPPDAVLVIDNASTDGTVERLREKGYVPPEIVGDAPASVERILDSALSPSGQLLFNYVVLKTNGGGAGGFSEGIRRAHLQGYDWIWVMDDDAAPREDALEKLLHHRLAGSEQTVALACRKVDDRGQLQVEHLGHFDPRTGHVPLAAGAYEKDSVNIDYASFVGLAIKRTAVDVVGGPRADFFISYDDVEYTLRLRHAGKLYVIPGSVIIHRDFTVNRPVRRVLGYHVSREGIGAYWNYLCHFRNKLYVMRTYGSIGLLGCLALLVRRLVRIWLLDDHKWLRTRWTLRYFRDSYRKTFTSITPEAWAEITRTSNIEH